MRPIGTAPGSISGKAGPACYARPQTCSVTHRSLTCVHLFSEWRSKSSVCYNLGRLRFALSRRPQQESVVIRGHSAWMGGLPCSSKAACYLTRSSSTPCPFRRRDKTPACCTPGCSARGFDGTPPPRQGRTHGSAGSQDPPGAVAAGAASDTDNGTASGRTDTDTLSSSSRAACQFKSIDQAAGLTKCSDPGSTSKARTPAMNAKKAG